MASEGFYSINRRFLLGIILNGMFIAVELYYGFYANSVALIADAVHNAADVFGLALIWFSYIMAQRKAPLHFTFGYKNATIFAAFANAIIIFIAVGNLFWGSAVRIVHPQPVMSQVMILVASVGVLLNGLTALVFFKDRHKDLNILGVFLNMAIDATVSLGVVIAGALIWWQGWTWLDPAMGFIIAIAIVFTAWGFFKESINLIFQAVPSRINFRALQKDIKVQPEIIAYHDLHVWALSTTEVSLSVHIVVSKTDYNPEIVHVLTEKFRNKYGIQHTTVQMELKDHGKRCSSYC
jgi:cobalt-zinc-cadmium efflux system protein